MVRAFFPNMALTLVRRSTAKLPKNMYMFRCDPKYTKSEIREYLEKVYGVNVASVNTINYLGAWLLCMPVATHSVFFWISCEVITRLHRGVECCIVLGCGRASVLRGVLMHASSRCRKDTTKWRTCF
jgi:hypothetical protein